MPYNSLNDFAQRKAALSEELKRQEKEIKKLKRQIFSPPASSEVAKKGFFGRMASEMTFASAVAAFDGARLAWKLMRMLKKK